VAFSHHPCPGCLACAAGNNYTARFVEERLAELLKGQPRSSGGGGWLPQGQYHCDDSQTF
jgi:hypothetical protein